MLLPFERFYENENSVIQVCDDAQIKDNIVINFMREDGSKLHITTNTKGMVESQLLMFFGVPDDEAFDILNSICYVDLDKLQYYVENNLVTRFDSEQEALEYFNTYDYQNFKTIDDMLYYEGHYGLTIDGVHYHIDYDEALDVYTR